MVVAVEIEGVKETIRTLSKIDPTLRKEFTANARRVAEPAVNAAKTRYSSLPLSGFRRRWSPGTRTKPIFPTTAGRLRQGVSFKVDASKKAVTVFRIQQRNAAGEVIDYAGRLTNNQLSRSLTGAGWGTASRVMWPAVESKAPQIQAALANLVEAASDTINKELR